MDVRHVTVTLGYTVEDILSMKIVRSNRPNSRSDPMARMSFSTRNFREFSRSDQKSANLIVIMVVVI